MAGKAIRSYRDLGVWQKAIDLVDVCYLLTRRFPTDERYGLSSQIRRAAVSIPANIAEGNGRTGRGEYLRFLSIARGSLRELETLLIISERQAYGTAETFRAVAERAAEVGRMLYGLTISVEQSQSKGAPRRS